MRVLISLIVVVFLFNIKIYGQVDFLEYDYDKILKKSNIEKKNILIYFSAEYCVPCKAFEREIIQNEEVSKYINELYIPIKILSKGIRNDSLTQSLLDKFEIKGYPVLIFMSNNGEIIGRKDGINVPEDVIFNISDSLSQFEATEFTEVQKSKVKYNVERFIILFNEYSSN